MDTFLHNRIIGMKFSAMRWVATLLCSWDRIAGSALQRRDQSTAATQDAFGSSNRKSIHINRFLESGFDSGFWNRKSIHINGFASFKVRVPVGIHSNGQIFCIPKYVVLGIIKYTICRLSFIEVLECCRTFQNCTLCLFIVAKLKLIDWKISWDDNHWNFGRAAVISLKLKKIPFGSSVSVIHTCRVHWNILRSINNGSHLRICKIYI